ncbi:phage tail protein [Leisingera daeponensis]|uniref:Phage tail protein n=1 Tax=Leisingera daeponensis TaxID=405746 RepID=A0ABS7NBE1_9RHOB|nr:phage tail protein [Leisingera daeponensis]MBY6138520.1 phage tail protein [Leisingera daeponensis]
MKDKRTFWAVLMVALLAPAAAAADPITAWVATTLAVSTATAAFIVRIGISLVLSSLSSALRKKPGQPRQPGIKTESTTSGGSNPQSFILGTYASAGNMAAPPYSHPNSGDLPNKWLTYVVDVSDVPGVQLSRVMVGGEYVTDLDLRENVTGAQALAHDMAGMVHDGHPYLYLTWHDGTQTAADAFMLEEYADHPDRPWSADMTGTGVAYAVLTFHYSRKLFNQLPGVRFEVKGIPLYDPRKDSTAGGSGAHRWADPATWEFTENPIVMVYNILRGIALPDGQRWGGQASAAALPLDNWFAGMNECDVSVSLAAGGSEAQYRAGLEVLVDDEPAEVIQQLLKACSAEISELGGTYKVRVGPPALPVYFFTDEDVIADRPQSLVPYPGLDGVHNAIHASHPDPESLWESRDAPPRYNAGWEAEDGGRQLVAEVDLPAVASVTQVQRLMKAWIEDERRFRRHSLTLPPDAALLEPLDTVAWTSAREGYTSKLFEVGELTDDLAACLQTLALRERDAGDFTWVPGSDEVSVDHPSTAVTVLGPRTLPGFNLLPHSLPDGTGTARRPALRLVWSAQDLLADDVVEWEIQLADGTLVAAGRAPGPLSGEVVFASGILSQTAYRAKGRIRGRNDGIWTGWASATTADLRLGYLDLQEQIQLEVDAAQAAADNAAADATQALTDAAAAQAEIAAVRSRIIHSDFAADGAHWTSTESGAPGVNPLDARWTFADDPAEGRIARIADMQAAVEDRLFTRGVFVPKVGRTYRVTTRVRLTGTISGAGSNFNITRRGLDASYAWVSNDGTGFEATGTWQDFVKDFVCTAGNVSAFWRLGVFRHSADTGDGAFEVAYVQVEDLTVADQLEAEIETIRELDASGMTGSALATLITQLQVDAGGTSATITDHASAVADMDGFAAAHAGLTVTTSSGKIAGLKATSWIDPDGEGGALLELLGDVIAEGSLATNRLLVGIGKNLLENPDFTQGQVGFEFDTNNEVGSGANIAIRTDDSSYSKPFHPSVRLQTFAENSGNGWIGCSFKPVRDNGSLGVGYSVDPNKFYEFSAKLNVRRAQVSVRIYWYQDDGSPSAVTPYSQVAPDHNQTGADALGPLVSWTARGGVAQPPSDAAYAVPTVRLVASRGVNGEIRDVHIFHPMFAETSEGAALSPYSPGGSTYIDGGRLVADSVTTEALKAGSVTAAKANFADLASLNITVKNLDVEDLTLSGEKMQANAVTKSRISTGSSPSITWTPTIKGEATFILDVESSIGAWPAARSVDIWLRVNGTNRRRVVLYHALDGSTAEAKSTAVWKMNTTGGAQVTAEIWVNHNGGGGAPTQSASLIALETKR